MTSFTSPFRSNCVISIGSHVREERQKKRNGRSALRYSVLLASGFKIPTSFVQQEKNWTVPSTTPFQKSDG